MATAPTPRRPAPGSPVANAIVLGVDRGADPRHRTRRARRRLQGLRRRRLLLLRLGQRRRAGHPRRRRRDQLLDLRWYPAVHRSGRAGVLRRLRRRGFRRGVGRQRRTRRRHRQPSEPVGDHGRGVHPAARVRIHADRSRAATETFTATGASITAGVTDALRWSGPAPLRTAGCAATRRRRPAPSPARSSPASAAATPGSTRATTSCTVGRSAWCSTTRRWPTSRPTTIGCQRFTWPTAPSSSTFLNAHPDATASFTAGVAGHRSG